MFIVAIHLVITRVQYVKLRKLDTLFPDILSNLLS